MVSDTGLAVGALIVSEATGVTNFSGALAGGGGGGPSGGAGGIAGWIETVREIPQRVTQTTEAVRTADRVVRETQTVIERTVGLDGGGGGFGGFEFSTDWLGTDQGTPDPAGPDPTPSPAPTPAPGGWTGEGEYPFAFQQRGPSDPLAIGAEVLAEGGELFGSAGDWVRENPVATGGAAAGIAAAPFTGGLSVPIGLAGAGAAGEVSLDVASGQYGEGPVYQGPDPLNLGPDKGPLWKGPDPLNLGGSDPAPADAGGPSGPLWKGPDPLNLGGSDPAPTDAEESSGSGSSSSSSGSGSSGSAAAIVEASRGTGRVPSGGDRRRTGRNLGSTVPGTSGFDSGIGLSPTDAEEPDEPKVPIAVSGKTGGYAGGL